MPDLDILGAGNPSRHAADLVGEALHTILPDAERDYDLVIVDAPPLLGFPEPLQIATEVDGVVMVGLTGRTDHGALECALGTLQRVGANVVGLVLNEVTDTATGGFSYNAYYAK